MKIHGPGACVVGTAAILLAGTLASMAGRSGGTAGAQPVAPDQTPAAPAGVPADVATKFKNYKQPDIAGERLKRLLAKMKPEYRFQIGRTSVLERAGLPLRGFRSGRSRQLVIKPPERRPAAMAMMVIPPALDYVAMGRVTPAKGQWCNDCWAFTAASICESAYIKTHTEAWPDFSEQCLVDCVGNDCGCGGGYFDFALDFVLKSGVCDEEAYSYTGWDDACAVSTRSVHKAASWGFVNVADPFGLPSDAELKQALLEHGPLAVGICWSELADAYLSGVLNNCADASGPVDHAVTLAGWDDARGAWRIKNSMGSGWGDQGFAWVEYGCASIGTMAVWVEME